MNKLRHNLYNILITVFIVLAFLGASLFINEVFEAQSLVPAVFTLAVFLVSMATEGYIFGIAASLLSVLAVNYAFTFPYLKFNFTITENLVSAIIMFVITIMTSALATKVKQTEKMKAESEKEKMRANLLRAISHDLRTPLTTIYGSSSTILEGHDSIPVEQRIHLVQGIKEDAQWLIGMVENLLSVTRIDGVGVRLIKTPVVLEELIDTVLVRFRKRYPDQEVRVDIPEEFISIPMDAVLIEQVIVNLLENAVLHAQGMSELLLSVFQGGKSVVFEISDDGCGIPRDRLAGIFSGYYEKKDVPVDNQKRSMGIGLSVCASIIKAHDGEICVENRKDGGCTFRFTLDREAEDHGQ